MGGGNEDAHLANSPYGAVDSIDIEKSHLKSRTWASTLKAFLCWLVPCSIFTLLYALLSLPTHFHEPALHWTFAVLCLLLIFTGGFLELSAVLAVQTRQGFVFFTSLVAFVLAIALGNENWRYNMQVWIEYSTKGVAVDVDPATMVGQEVMDAGRVLFSPNVHLALEWSASFRQSEEYCVVPVVSTEKAVPSGAFHSYDFWAIGMNCCNNPRRSFACSTHRTERRSVGGVRLLDKSQENFYRLAVKNAEALHNISAANPVFVSLSQNPFQAVRYNWFRGVLWTGFGVLGHAVGHAWLVVALLPSM